jgi:hypothetical protein
MDTALQLVSTPPTAKVTLGQEITTSVVMTNMLSARDPIVLTAEATWTDESGNPMSTSAETSVNVIQPITVNRYKVTMPDSFFYVADSAKVDGQPITPIVGAGQVAFELERNLLENESVTLEYTIKTL